MVLQNASDVIIRQRHHDHGETPAARTTGRPGQRIYQKRENRVRHDTENEIELKRVLEEWERLLDAVPAMVFFKDTENRFVRVNRAYAEAIGLSKSEIIGKSVGDFVTDTKTAAALWEDDREVIETGRPKRNITTSHITDAQRWLRTEKIPFRNPDGQIIGVAGLSVDISDMKRIEAELDGQVRQQKAIADLGQRALSGIDCKRLFHEAATLVSETLGAEYCQILEYLNDQGRCVLRAGNGGTAAFCEKPPCGDGKAPPPRCSTLIEGPIVIADLKNEPYYRDLFPVLVKMGVASGLVVVIGPKANPFGVLGAHTTRRRGFSRTDIDFLQGIANMLALAVEQERARHAIRDSSRQLRHLSSQLIEAQEEERHRIYRALHDELGQSLAMLKLQIRALQMKLDPQQTALKEDCDQTLIYVKRVIENVRRLCHDLTPSALEDLGLNAALRWLFEEFARHFDFKMTVHLDNVDPIFRRDAQIMIYRIFQEALTNVLKHAGASRVGATLVKRSEDILCQVVDNGKGMDPKRAVRHPGPDEGIGLATMGERARMLGGLFEVDTRPGGGTRIRVTVPIDGGPD